MELRDAVYRNNLLLARASIDKFSVFWISNVKPVMADIIFVKFIKLMNKNRTLIWKLTNVDENGEISMLAVYSKGCSSSSLLIPVQWPYCGHSLHSKQCSTEQYYHYLHKYVTHKL